MELSNEMKYVLFAAVVAVMGVLGWWVGGQFLPSDLSWKNQIGAAGGALGGVALAYIINMYMFSAQTGSSY